MNVQVASDLLELADLCGGDKKQFAAVADFIVNRLLLVNQCNGVERLRTDDELRPYIIQLMQAGSSLQPLSREDAYQACLPYCENPSLINKLLGCDGVAVTNKRYSKQSPKRQYDATQRV